MGGTPIIHHDLSRQPLWRLDGSTRDKDSPRRINLRTTDPWLRKATRHVFILDSKGDSSSTHLPCWVRQVLLLP